MFAGYDTPSFISCSFFSLIQPHSRVFELGFRRADSPFPEHYCTVHLQPTPEKKRKEKLYANFFPYGKLGSERPTAHYSPCRRGSTTRYFKKEEPLLFFWERSVLYVPTLPTLSLLPPAYLVFGTKFNKISGHTFYYNMSNVSILFLKKYAANSVLQKSVW